LIPEISHANFNLFTEQISGSASVDVTGGMIEKVRAMLELASQMDSFEACIFSGLEPGSVKNALLGASLGTTIHY
jgi:isopentenyl phosphate kinase